MLLSLALSLALQTQTAPPAAFDAEARIQEAIAAVRPMAYRSELVDWSAIEADMRRRAVGARNTGDMLPVYAALASSLGDNHSFIQPTDAARQLWRETHSFTPLRPPPNSAFINRTAVESRDVSIGDAHTARLVVVPSIGGSGEPARSYAARLFSAVADAGPETCGYLLDLRGNGGGNVWPMLTGLSALSGDGPAGRTMDRAGELSTYAELKEGVAVVVQEGGDLGLTVMTTSGWRPMPHLASVPVAVLIDDGVFSSGEGVAVHFKGRPATRFFGQRTGGLASSNDNAMLSDGTNMVITVAMMADRNGGTHPLGVEPDEPVAAGAGSHADPDDAVVETAKTWLATQASCAG